MADVTMTAPGAAVNPRATLQEWLPKLVLAPSFALILLFVYGFIIFTAVLSFTGSKLLPDFSTWVGFGNYVRLFNHPNWITSLKNLAIFATLYIVVCSGARPRPRHPARPEDPRRGRHPPDLPLSDGALLHRHRRRLEVVPRSRHRPRARHAHWGWESFSFRWIKEGKMAIYTIVIAAVWQSSGFVMAMFLAGLRGVDNEIIKAAQIDGASTVTIYRRIIIPLMRPVFLSAFVVLAHLAIKSYDLVVAMTDGGPGTATWTPALFMQKFTFGRNEMAMGASSAIIMMMMIFSIIVPYLYSELRGGRRQ